MSESAMSNARTEVDERPTPDPLLCVRDLTVEFNTGRRRRVKTALSHVSLSIDPGETVGVVGESGSGKTTLGKAILGLVAIKGGEVSYAGRNITNASRRVRRSLGQYLQVVFQDPFGSMNPAKRIGVTLAEPLYVHQKLSRDDARERVSTMLDRVGLSPNVAERFPPQFSGGQLQRIAIARALMVQPQLVICDEPVSALDLSIQAQVLNLLADVQRDFGLSYLFIAHNLDVVYLMSHRIVVVYRGQIMEQGSAEDVYKHPAHP